MNSKIGKIVWYRPVRDVDPGPEANPTDRLAAIVAAQLSGAFVNLMVIDSTGRPFVRQATELVAPGAVPRPGQCEWPAHEDCQVPKAAASRAEPEILQQNADENAA